MRVFKPTRKGARGARMPYRTWYVEFRDHLERARRLPAFSDKGASEELGRKLDRLVTLRAAGEVPDRALSRFVEELPKRMREKLAKIGLLDRRRLAAARPLTYHVEGYERSLLNRGNVRRYVTDTLSRIRAVLEGTGAAYLSDLDPAKVERFLAGLRERGLGISTSNAYLGAVRSFLAWMVSSGLAAEDPLRVLKNLNAAADRRRVRRAPSKEELEALLAATLEGPVHLGLDGRTRAWIYRIAAETGLRANEIRTLRVLSFEDLDGPAPRVRVEAAYSKRRREDVLPLRAETARELAPFLAARLPGSRPFPVPSKPAAMLREDLAAAGIPYRDENGRTFDFHSLRHGFISALARCGVEPKVAQALARHSSITLTLDRYTHLRSGDERRGIESLPPIGFEGGPASERATGTEGDCDMLSVASSVASRAASHCAAMQPHAPRPPRKGPRGGRAGVGEGARTPDLQNHNLAL